MPLPTTGPLSLNDINNEINICNWSLRTQSGAVGKTTPDAISEFRGYNGAYIFGSPQLVFDFNIVSQYSNSGTQIKDLSGNNNHGTFVTGTGTGTATTVTGYTWGYLSLPGSASQLSVRIPDALKPSGNNPFSIVVYMRPKGYSYNGNTPGIVSHGDNTQGLSWYLNSDVPGQAVWRDINCGDNGYTSLAYQAGAGLNQWSGYAITSSGYNHRLYQYAFGTLYNTLFQATQCGITTLAGWGFFLGLRYNQWLNADINYVAIYNSQLTAANVTSIFSTLQGRFIGSICNA
jgi:hypothetical protein